MNIPVFWMKASAGTVVILATALLCSGIWLTRSHIAALDVRHNELHKRYLSATTRQLERDLVARIDYLSEFTQRFIHNGVLRQPQWQQGIEQHHRYWPGYDYSFLQSTESEQPAVIVPATKHVAKRYFDAVVPLSDGSAVDATRILLTEKTLVFNVPIIVNDILYGYVESALNTESWLRMTSGSPDLILLANRSKEGGNDLSAGIGFSLGANKAAFTVGLQPGGLERSETSLLPAFLGIAAAMASIVLLPLLWYLTMRKRLADRPLSQRATLPETERSNEVAHTGADDILLSDILNHLSESVAYFNVSNQLIRWNDVFADTFGHDQKWLNTQPSFAVVAQNICKLLAVDSSDSTRRWWEQAGKDLPNHEEIPAELELSNGRFYLTKQSAVSTHGRVLLFYDVTTLVQREMALEQSNRDLEQFAYIASHDLQEPLRMVASFTELLQQKYKGKLDDTAQQYIQYAVDGARRMHTLLEELLRFSRVNSNPPEYDLVDLTEVCDCAIQNLGPLIAERNAIIHKPEVLPTVPGNQVQLIQVFQNLLKNGIIFNRNSPELYITANDRNGLWVLQISDNGIGLEGKHMEKIFIIFQRLNNRSMSHGNGLGLAICKKIIESHGGRIWVDSLLGEGSTFTFTLPTTTYYNYFKDTRLPDSSSETPVAPINKENELNHA